MSYFSKIYRVSFGQATHLNGVSVLKYYTNMPKLLNLTLTHNYKVLICLKVVMNIKLLIKKNKL